MAIGAELSGEGTPQDRRKCHPRSGWPAAGAAALLLFLVLALPNEPEAFAAGALTVLPLELPVIVALLLAAAYFGRAGLVLRVAATALLLAAAVLKLADYGLFTALNRPFNVAHDLPLLHAGWVLLVGSSGTLAAAATVGAAFLAVVMLAGALWWATGALVAAGADSSRRTILAAAGLAGLAALGAMAGIGSAGTMAVARGHADNILQASRDIAALEAEAADDPAAALIGNGLLARLGKSDVILAFVESYGRSTHDNPLYAPTTFAALEAMQEDLEGRGLAMRSAWLTAPIVGGQSWLAHATMLSGLWINHQGRYGALLRSRRSTLVTLLAASGRRTVAVKPAITMPWPEGDLFGYSRIYAARDLGYRGLPFNWVTMPDQYTWSAFERLELTGRADRRPVFAELALLSSHAPWTPIPTLIPWEYVGDGRVFNSQATSGDSPEVVWRETDRIRDHFRMSIDYALRTIGSFAARHAENPPVLIVLGDHQPPTFVSQSEGNRDVPIHIIAGASAIAHLDGWGWTKGLRPAADAPVWRMDRFRDRFIKAFSAPAPAADAIDGPS